MSRATVGPRRASSLTKYDPARGLKTIAVADAAEKHWARAKDAKKLLEAIRAKLAAQLDFVEWWDQVAEKDRGAAQPRHNRSVKALRLGKDGLPDPMVVSRWRKRLDAEHFDATYEAACAKYRAIVELEHGVHVAQATGNFEWYSPAEYVEAARDVLGGFDLDPASSAQANTVIKAAQFYARNDLPLAQPWAGRVWMNPPYAAGVVDQFAAKLAEDYTDGAITEAVVLVNNATETEWFQVLAGVSAAICFPKGRLKFWRPAGGVESVPLQGQAVLYCGADHVETFADRFAVFGLVVGVRQVTP
jgi:hypothetical protein